jgi:hypothetical protein
MSSKAAKKPKASTQANCEFRDEEGNLRCEVCKLQVFRCYDCVELQKGIEKSQKDITAKAALNAAKKPNCEFRDEEGKLRCEGCRFQVFQCFNCVGLQKGIEKSQKDAAKAAKISDQDAQYKAKQDLFHSLIRLRFNVRNIARDGDCLFHSFIAAQRLHNKEQLAMKQLRGLVADHLIEKVQANGQFPGQPYDFFEKNHEGACSAAAVARSGWPGPD